MPVFTKKYLHLHLASARVRFLNQMFVRTTYLYMNVNCKLCMGLIGLNNKLGLVCDPKHVRHASTSRSCTRLVPNYLVLHQR